MIFSNLFPKNFLGIDIGTTAVKAVEISKWGQRKKLKNYGEVSIKALYEKPFRTFEKSTLLLSSKDVALAIRAIVQDAGIKTKKCIFSIPDFSSFFTTFELPPMTKEELPQAVEFEARQYVPLPLSEVTLDWQMMESGPALDKNKIKAKILLAAVPNDVINQYREIGRLCGLELLALEAEVFGLIRSLVPDDNKDILSIVDIGAQSTTCSIIKKKVLLNTHSFDMGGNGFTAQVAKSLSVDYTEADKIKRKFGLNPVSPEDAGGFPTGTREVLIPLVDAFVAEVERTIRGFSQAGGGNVQKIILAGGTALLPGMKEYCQDYFKKEVEVANPFSNIFCPPILEKTLKEMGPAYAIAVGMALRGLE